ncbi:hypothetical protein [Streptomyces sporangiiformans]|uniref:Uncharacterized protein n=1 Tax=Streptomyces sporangiiformans TaxID=2315329 RepID=A0A505DAA0_9ACTN|nr:hypothetical protein [Streptomyces sporangiiformans]TPQ20644.1 hypothetical protein FGD71_019670 [Streptomyces sporangiiformans]
MAELLSHARREYPALYDRTAPPVVILARQRGRGRMATPGAAPGITRRVLGTPQGDERTYDDMLDEGHFPPERPAAW